MALSVTGQVGLSFSSTLIIHCQWYNKFYFFSVSHCVQVHSSLLPRRNLILLPPLSYHFQSDSRSRSIILFSGVLVF